MVRTRPHLVPLLAATLWSGSVVAQQLLDFGAGALPACAQQCTILQTAQTGCVPPAAPVTNQAIYDSCFCQSGYLTQLRTNAAADCGSVCSGDDLTQIQTWYTNFCAGDSAAQPASAQTTTDSNPTTTTAPAHTHTKMTTTSTSTSTAGASSGSSGVTIDSSSNGPPGPWWNSHWKWIVMLIVIGVGLGLLAWGTVLLRRHYRRKADQGYGRFNDGVTSRSMAQVQTAGLAGAGAMPATDSRSTLARDSSGSVAPPVPPRGKRMMNKLRGSVTTEMV